MNENQTLTETNHVLGTGENLANDPLLTLSEAPERSKRPSEIARSSPLNCNLGDSRRNRI